MTSIEVEGVSKHFGGVPALTSASFSATGGEVHALLGENGAGKSTFIKILAGVQPPDGGTIDINGTRMAHVTPRAMREAGIGAVFQELSLVPDFDVARNVWYENEPRTRLRTLSAATMRRRTADLFDELGLPALPVDVPVRDLPISSRHLVEIAKVMARRPSTLIVDEPTSALAPHEAEMVLQLVRRHSAAGGLCIFISHRLSEVRQVADRVTIFRNGTNVTTLAPADADDDTMISHIIGRRMDQLFPVRGDARERVVVRATNLSVPGRIRDVGLEIREGEILGVGGLAGQGQRELLLRMFGAMRGHGHIEIDGTAVNVRSPHDALAAGIALIPEDRQHEGLLMNKSVSENLSLTRLGEISKFGVISSSRERRLSKRLINDLNIVAKRDRMPVDGLSGGNQQKVVIGKFLAPTTKLLLCYDPTRGVDIGARQAIFELLHQLAADGKAILFFSTDNSELINMAHRVLVLAGGQVGALLEGSSITEDSLVGAALGQTQSPSREGAA